MLRSESKTLDSELSWASEYPSLSSLSWSRRASWRASKLEIYHDTGTLAGSASDSPLSSPAIYVSQCSLPYGRWFNRRQSLEKTEMTL